MALSSVPEGHKYNHVLIQPADSIFLPLEYEGTVKQLSLSSISKLASAPSSSSIGPETILINITMRDYIKDLLEHGHGDAVRAIANPTYVVRPLVRDAAFLDEFGIYDNFILPTDELLGSNGVGGQFTVTTNNTENYDHNIVPNIKYKENEPKVSSSSLKSLHSINLQKVLPVYTQGKKTPTATTTVNDIRIPEIAYINNTTVPNNTSNYIYIADGKGILKCSELSGGLILYEGEWRNGMRHGSGRGTIFVRSVPTTTNQSTHSIVPTLNNVQDSISSPAIFLGVYEGNWICGLRHGRGIFTEDAGSKYEGEWAFDIKHGQGIETSAGGGVFRGAWCRGQRHGCGTFIWPNGRSESREYEYGNIIAVRVNTTVVPTTPSLGPELNINGSLSRIASGINLSIPSASALGTANSSTSSALQLFRTAGIHPTPSMTNLQAAATAAAAAANAAAIAAKAQLQVNASLGTTLSPHTGVLENMDNNNGLSNNANLILAEALHNNIPPNASIINDSNGNLTTSNSNNNITGLSLDHAATSPTGSSGVLPSLVTAYGGIPFLHHPNLHLQFPVVTASGKPVSVSLNADVLRLLRHTSVGDLPAYRGKVVSVEKRDTVESCLTKMSDRNVLSVPVYDAEAGRYVAVLHMLDLFAFMLDLVAKKKATFSPSSGGLRETLAHQKRFALAPVSEVLAMARHLSPIAFRPLPAGTPLIYAAQILAEGGHAVPIVDSMAHRTTSISEPSNVNNPNSISTPSTPVTGNIPTSPHPLTAFVPTAHRSTINPMSPSDIHTNITATSSFVSSLSPNKVSTSGTNTPQSGHTAPTSPASNSPSFTATAATLSNIPSLSSTSVSPVPPLLSTHNNVSNSTANIAASVDTSPVNNGNNNSSTVTPPSTNTDPSPGNIVRMITQADIIRYVAAHLDQLGPLGTMTVSELGLGTTNLHNNSSDGTNDNNNDNNLVIARFTDRAFDVLQAMRARHAPAAPVVDQYGAMAANLSLSDVKTIARRANFSALNLPISQFFRAVDKGVEAMNPSIYVRASTTFASLVLTLAATRIHQLYFVDEQLHPIGSVRIGDVLKILVDEGPSM